MIRYERVPYCDCHRLIAEGTTAGLLVPEEKIKVGTPLVLGTRGSPGPHGRDGPS